MTTGTRSEQVARVVGMIVFLLGVALLIFVFFIAHDLFVTPPAQALGLKFTGDPKRDPQVAAIGTQFVALLFRIAYLIIMSIAGSLIAQKGVNLYFSALHVTPQSTASSQA